MSIWNRISHWPGFAAVAVETGEPPSTYQSMRRELQTVETLSTRFLVVLLFIILFYAFAVWQQESKLAPAGLAAEQLAAWSPRGFLFTVGIYLSLLASAAIGGGFLGFLFGIPRLLQRSSVTADNGSEKTGGDTAAAMPTFAGNTNLEEISDWLTKIIVGLGLTQAGNIYSGYLIAKNEFANTSMRGLGGSEAMFATILVSGLVLGFLFFYLQTRTRLTLLLVSADQVQSALSPRRALAKAGTAPDQDRLLNSVRISNSQGLAPTKPPSEADRKIATVDLTMIDNPGEIVAWGMSQIKLSNFRAAEDALRKAIEKAPDRPELQTTLAAIKNWRGQAKAANDILDDALKQFPGNAKVLRDKLLASLYLEPPQSYTEALAAATALKASDPAATDDPFVWLWTACAYGQKYSHVATPEEKATVEQEALKAVRAVIAKSPPGSPVRKTLREVFDPAREGSDPTENDLEVFKAFPPFAEEIRKAV